MSSTALGTVETLPSDWTHLAETEQLANNGTYSLYHVADNQYSVVYTGSGVDSNYRAPKVQKIDMETRDLTPVIWEEIESRTGQEFSVEMKTRVNAVVEELILDTFCPVFDPENGPDATDVPVVDLSDNFFAVEYSSQDLQQRLETNLQEDDELPADRIVELLETWAGDYLCGIDLRK